MALIIIIIGIPCLALICIICTFVFMSRRANNPEQKQLRLQKQLDQAQREWYESGIDNCYEAGINFDALSASEQELCCRAYKIGYANGHIDGSWVGYNNGWTGGRA